MQDRSLETDSGMVKHAMNEFIQAGWADREGNWKPDSDGDHMQQLMCENILEVLQCLSNQNHSGFSMGYLKRQLNRLIDYKPLTPLTGEEDEWSEPMDVEGRNFQQNKRFPAVFREDGDNKKAYWQSGRVFVENTGSAYTNHESRVMIEKFPWYVPDKPEYVRVDGDVDADMD